MQILAEAMRGWIKGDSAMCASMGDTFNKEKIVLTRVSSNEITLELTPLQICEICTLRFNDV